jgi:BirA family biotin operon repressor/biotin-[acetyl-CoA-carboxylase] ligase
MTMLAAFDHERVRTALAGTPFAAIEYRPRTGSTNDDAAQILGAPGSAGRTIVAEYQLGGKGRRGRVWIAPAGSALLFTTILPPIRADALWAVPFWASMRVAEAVEEAYGITTALQWPNDLLIGERKVCGILSVSRVGGTRADVGCGVGINVTRPSDLGEFASVQPEPAFLSDHPTIPGEHMGAREDLLAAILLRFAQDIGDLEAPDAVARHWEAAAGLPGAAYRLLADGSTEVATATALRLDAQGALVAAVAGREQRFTLADARVVRTPSP